MTIVNLVCGAVGSLIGSIVAMLMYNHRAIRGTLQIDHSDPEKDRFNFVISERDLVNIHKKKRLIAEIDNNANLSHE